MPYTKERLEQALKLYRENSCHSFGRCLPSVKLEYNLRSCSLRNPASVVHAYLGDIWNSGVNNQTRNSDDDDYDPREENRRRKAVAKKKRNPCQKRKEYEDNGDTDRNTRKSKQDDTTDDTQSAYLTLEFITEEGRKLLGTLADIHGPHHPRQLHREISSIEQNYFSRIDSNLHLRRTVYLSDDEDGWNHVGDATKLTTGLRSGKVLVKPIDTNEKATSKKTSHDDYPQHNEEMSGLLTPPPESDFTNKGSIHHAASSTEKSDTAHTFQPSAQEQPKITSSFLSSKPRSQPAAASQELIQAPRQFSSYFRPSKPTEPLRDQPGLLVVQTHYAHPVDFQGTAVSCDFCRNYRMGLMGLGQKSVSLFRDPQNPTKLEEAGDGWRAHGFAPTKMCTVCARKRMMIVRCHAVEPTLSTVFSSQSSSSSSSANQPQFIRIPGCVYSAENYTAYARDLFDPLKRPMDYAEPRGKEHGPLPSCSLCLSPAVWKCCKWQDTNMFGERCRIPILKTITPSDSNELGQGKHRPTIASFFRIPKPRPEYIVVEEMVNGKKRDLVLLDSDSESDAPPQPPAKKPRLNNPLPLTTAVPQRSMMFLTPTPSPSPEATRTATSTTPTECTARLKSPIQGCGLKLCNKCKQFLQTKCDGKLDPTKVWSYLRNDAELGPRADLRFLFKGGDLDKVYRVLGRVA